MSTDKISIENTATSQGVVALPFNEGLILGLLAAINFTHIMDFVIIAPLNPFLKEVFGITTKEFGLLMSAYTLSAGIFGFLGFFFIDKFDRKKALLILYSGFAISNLLCALADSYVLFMAARIFAGAFGGILGALVLSIVGDAIPAERRGKATGIVMSAFSAASIVGIPAGLYLAGKFSWHAPFVLITALSCLVLAGVMIYFPSMKGHLTSGPKQSAWKMLSTIFGNINVRWALLFSVLLMMAGFTVVPFLSDYMVNNVGLDKSELSYIYLFGGLATVVTSPLIGRLADKFGKRKVFLVAAGFSLIPVLLVTHMADVSKAVAFTISTIFFIAFGGRFVPAMAMITSTVEPRNRGKFMSISSCFQQLSSSVASFGAGMLIVNGADGKLYNFGLVGVIACVAAVLCMAVSFKIKQIA